MRDTSARTIICSIGQHQLGPKIGHNREKSTKGTAIWVHFTCATENLTTTTHRLTMCYGFFQIRGGSGPPK
jgi:hypothetical protein